MIMELAHGNELIPPAKIPVISLFIIIQVEVIFSFPVIDVENLYAIILEERERGGRRTETLI